MLKLMNAIQENKPPYSLTRLADYMDVPDSTLEPYFRLLRDNKFATVVLDFSRKIFRIKINICYCKRKVVRFVAAQRLLASGKISYIYRNNIKLLFSN